VCVCVVGGGGGGGGGTGRVGVYRRTQRVCLREHILVHLQEAPTVLITRHNTVNGVCVCIFHISYTCICERGSARASARACVHGSEAKRKDC
jgi:hypothetical protein